MRANDSYISVFDTGDSEVTIALEEVTHFDSYEGRNTVFHLRGGGTVSTSLTRTEVEGMITEAWERGGGFVAGQFGENPG